MAPPVSTFRGRGRAQDPLAAASAAGRPGSLAASIEELAQLPGPLGLEARGAAERAPTALFVITGDDIARSPANSLTEVLRLAPNLQVQQVNARDYAISARGFNGYETSNKLLVLMDGRSLYSTLHSGVFWELRQPLLDDIAQIEVISGPGGTLYGPNAVNGVINITTRDARETIGGLVRATVGSNELTVGARYGFAIGDQRRAALLRQRLRSRRPARRPRPRCRRRLFRLPARLPLRFGSARTR